MNKLHEIMGLLRTRYGWVALLLLIVNILMILMIVDILTSCTEKDLCFHHDHVVKLRVAFDWRDAPDANPMGMVLFFYPEEECRGGESGDGNGTIRLDLRGREGAEISIPVGQYRIVAYNNDTEVCFGYYTDYWTQHHLRTRYADILEMTGGGTGVRGTDTPRPEGTESEQVVMQPDEVWGCNATEVHVSEQGISYKCFPLEEKDEWIGLPPTVTENVITLYPRDLLCRYSYEIRNVKGLSSVKDVCAAITGMSPAFVLGDMVQSEETTTLPLAGRKEGESTIRGEFLTFGHPWQKIPHRFGLYVWADKNTPYFFGNKESNFDLTLQVDTAPDQRRVHLVIDSLDLTKEGVPVSGGSFNPGFNEWGEQNKDIHI